MRPSTRGRAFDFPPLVVGAALVLASCTGGHEGGASAGGMGASSTSIAAGTDAALPRSLTRTMPRPPPPKIEGQSKNWRITVESVQRESDDSIVVNLDWVYLGPSGMVRAPKVSLIDSKGRSVAPDSVKRLRLFIPSGQGLNPEEVEKLRNDLHGWLSSGAIGKPKSRKLRTNDGQPAFLFSFPAPHGDPVSSFRFGDIGPIGLAVQGR